MKEEIKQKPRGMHLEDLLIRLGVGRTTFYTKYYSLIKPKKLKDNSKKVYLLEDIEKLEKLIADSQEIEIVKA